MIIKFKNFTLMDEKEIKMVYNWRYSDRINSKMINQEIPSFKQHLEWINGLAEKKNSLYYIVTCDNKYIGVVDFTNFDITNKMSEWGFYVNEQSIGYGALLEYYSIEHLFNDLNLDTLYCRVLENNPAVYNYHKRHFGFVDDKKHTKKIRINNKELELKGLSITKERWQEYKTRSENFLNRVFNIESVIWEKTKME